MHLCSAGPCAVIYPTFLLRGESELFTDSTRYLSSQCLATTQQRNEPTPNTKPLYSPIPIPIDPHDTGTSLSSSFIYAALRILLPIADLSAATPTRGMVCRVLLKPIICEEAIQAMPLWDERAIEKTTVLQQRSLKRATTNEAMRFTGALPSYPGLPHYMQTTPDFLLRQKYEALCQCSE